MQSSDLRARAQRAWQNARAAPLRADAWAHACHASLDAGDLAGVGDGLDHMEAMGLGDVGAWRGLAERLEVGGLWMQAYRPRRRVVDLTPDDPDAYRRLAAVLIGAGELSAALVVLETALRLAPDDAATHRMLARGHLARGHLGRAEPHARRAVDLEPEHPSVTSLVEALGVLGPAAV